MKALLIGCEPVDYTIAYANAVVTRMPVTLVLPRDKFAAALPWLDPAITVELMDWPRHRSLANLAFLWRLTRLIRSEQPDLIHILSNTQLWLNLAMPFWRSIPVVTTVHDVRLHPGDRDTGVLPGWSPRLMARQSDHLVVHGPTLARAATQVFGKPASHVHVLPHPAIRRYVELAQEEGLRPRIPDGVFRVLMFGRIFAYKGLDQLLRAEQLLLNRTPQLQIIVAGRGDNPWDMHSLMGDPARYDIRHRFIKDREVAQLFLDADLVVLPYTEASQSGVLPVAATFGVPVVVTDVGELRATVTPHDLGIVVAPADPQALADAIALMADDGALRDRCGRAALAWSDRVIGPEAVGEQAQAFYHCLPQKGEPAASKGWA